MYSYTSASLGSLSHKGPYDALLAYNILSFCHESAFHTDSQPGQGCQPPRTTRGWRDNSASRLLLFSTYSGGMLSEALECPQGSLLPLGLQAPSFIHKTTHSKALVLDRRQSTHARRFPTASHFAPIRDGVVDRELPDCDAPEHERSDLPRRTPRRTRSETPRRDVRVPREPSALKCRLV